ncbi:indolepyruvate oxidoreductase subunit beta family protein [Xinfangfangia sp. D13-10-4-6]|uniref:indolepyruvate oxidoreductase subunit beta family protein n=1 Tax=Pseudogemmobacter hezensis TaxID=2737662 RepID=UPI001554B6EF|nr:indolepyruvate oxidoreductase subunit beta family protein [Pseudogemmobacter hezensis]NPD14840.1 indolepyruvate oxidoreductase subunit beta family protein [Pseudogemmobacter hezensis]
MSLHEVIPPRQPDEKLKSIIKVAIYAVGGQGGGVLTGWIEDVARSQGFAAQATSVAGVSQRTGATIYYVEMAPKDGGDPVFSLMPAAGDVDVMIAAEWMEAGRAIIRGFVTPDRTTLIASTHRNLAVSEKMVPGDGVADPEAVREAAIQTAKRLLAADYEAVAVKNGSIISSTLFGALAASGALPFPRQAFEDAIRHSGGKGIEASLRAFGAGYDAALNGDIGKNEPAPAVADTMVRGPAKLMAAWEKLVARLQAMPAPVAEMGEHGLRKVVSFQDIAYGADYLDRLQTVLDRDHAPWDLSVQAAKYIANAMCYDDVIRVADLKTRGNRFARIRGEMGAKDQHLMQLTEFMHPRAEEIAGMLPLKWGARVEANPKSMARLNRWFGHGRRIRTDSFRGYAMLYLLGGMKFWRRRTLRHAQEVAHLEAWLTRALAEVDRNYALAVELIRCRRLIKGYSDTHARGLSKFDRVIAAIDLVAGREDAADWARRLREAALKDEEGKDLDGAIQTIRSFV